MIKNVLRIGNFTSSEIVALMSEPTATAKKQGAIFGSTAFTYIRETNMERRLGRSLEDEKTAKPLTWGKFLESRVFGLLGLDYTLSSQETDQHPTIKFWSGSKDGLKHDEGKTVTDIKCPLTLKSFCQLVDPLYDGLTGMDAINKIRERHKNGDKYYWQLVSNSIINNTRFAELIVYMPYHSELEDIKVEAQQVEAQDLSKHYWIAMASEDELPYLNDGGFYKNLNIIRFEVPQEDKDYLTERVTAAGKLLVDWKTLSVVVDKTILPSSNKNDLLV
jgi:hypothetical protein